MIVFPNCKINLGLHITRKREDGYHDLETIFYPVQLRDALECVRSTGDHNNIGCTITGLPVAGAMQDNLCIKAYHLLQKDFPDLPPVEIHLHKAIPMGAGLGGGSADGAFTLKLLNQLFHLGLTQEQLTGYALQLGSDCPFFIRNKPAFATGRGEVIEDIALDLSGYDFVIVHPGIHISTAEAFAGIVPRRGEWISKKVVLEVPVEDWKHYLSNDFEEFVCKQHPEISTIKETLYANGAVYASMTGSGSSVYGLFKKGMVPSISLPAHYSTSYVEHMNNC